MRIAISQPEHLPYIGYFHKIYNCDLFVILDHVQFSGPRSFQNRNKFINKQGEIEWFTVPVSSNSYITPINMVQSAPDYGWRKKLIRKMHTNFPGLDYEAIYKNEKLIDINVRAIKLCMNALQINTPIVFSSDYPVQGNKGELIFNLCQYLGATIYVSGLGAKEYLCETNFHDISIEYLTPVSENYDSIVTLIHNKSYRLEETIKLIKGDKKCET